MSQVIIFSLIPELKPASKEKRLRRFQVVPIGYIRALLKYLLSIVPKGSIILDMRQRATAVIIRDNKVLLVRDKGHKEFSLPGGGIKHDEPTVSAAAREVKEELGLSVSSVKRVHSLDCTGSLSQHKVCLVEATGEPHIREELDKYIWCNINSPFPVPVYGHVSKIMGRFKHPSAHVHSHAHFKIKYDPSDYLNPRVSH
jgi:8-oxo-dGTP pyrophosphatase MutT (NUDIX family)